MRLRLALLMQLRTDGVQDVMGRQEEARRYFTRTDGLRVPLHLDEIMTGLSKSRSCG